MNCNGNCKVCKVKRVLEYERETAKKVEETNESVQSTSLSVLSNEEPIEYSVKKTFGKKLIGVRK